MRKQILFVALLVPLIFVFRNLFMGSLTWGDAPYFYPARLLEFLAEPVAWTHWGTNFGGLGLVTWLNPLLVIIGLLGKAGFLSDTIVLFVFYIPSLVLSLFGSYLFARYLKLGSIGRAIVTILYTFNTYYLLLIDGGTVGVVLAYGIFPLALVCVKKLVDKAEHNSYLWAILASLALSVADFRFFLVLVISIVIWSIFDRKSVKPLVLYLAALFALTAYVWMPVLRFGSVGDRVFGDQLITLRHSLSLFQPHWPGNIFGKVQNPFWYFYGVTAISLFGLVKKSLRKYSLIFFAFTLLTAGIYIPLLANISQGVVLRDSSKFFAPLILFAGLLIAKFVGKNKLLGLGVAVYLLFLVHPALLGRLNFVLSERIHSGNVLTISERLSNKEGYFRTAWFPERHPMSFHTSKIQALDAKDLVNFRPLANINTGNFDLFNYLHNEEYKEWFNILGIKYLVFSGNQRVVKMDEEEQEQWDSLRKLVSLDPDLIKKDWADVDVYELPGARPNIYSTEKLNIVVGPQIGSLPAVYFEDGVVDPHLLERRDRESATIVLNGKDKDDLAMSFLQEYFLGPVDAANSQWARYSSDDFLLWKYQLLIREIETNEFDYGKGLAFSTELGEKIEYKFEVDEPGEYVLAVREMTDDNFGWSIKSVNVQSEYNLILENSQGIRVVNSVALVSKAEWDKATALADTFIEHFGITEVDELGEERWSEMKYESYSSLGYKIEAPEVGYWVIFTDNYHPKWKLVQGNVEHESIPVYSELNMFYTEPGWTKLSIEFEGQKDIRWGMYWSVVSGLLISIILMYKLPRPERF